MTWTMNENLIMGIISVVGVVWFIYNMHKHGGV
jgi:hypothetical protein